MTKTYGVDDQPHSAAAAAAVDLSGVIGRSSLCTAAAPTSRHSPSMRIC